MPSPKFGFEAVSALKNAAKINKIFKTRSLFLYLVLF